MTKAPPTSQVPTLFPNTPPPPPLPCRLLPILLSPVIGNPLSMALAGSTITPGPPTPARLAALADALIGLLPDLSGLRATLPQETLAWRLQLLQQGCQFLEGKLGQVGACLWGGTYVKLMLRVWLMRSILRYRMFYSVFIYFPRA